MPLKDLLLSRASYPRVARTLRLLMLLDNPCFKRSENYSIPCPGMRFIPDGRVVDVPAVVVQFVKAEAEAEAEAEESTSDSEAEEEEKSSKAVDPSDMDDLAEGDNYMRSGLDRFVPAAEDPYVTDVEDFRTAGVSVAVMDPSTYSERTRAVFEDADLAVMRGTALRVHRSGEEATVHVFARSWWKISLTELLTKLDGFVPTLRWFYDVSDGRLLVRNDGAADVALSDAGGFYRLGVPKKKPYPVVRAGEVAALEPFYAEDTEQMLVLGEEERATVAEAVVTLREGRVAEGVTVPPARYTAPSLAAALNAATPRLEWAVDAVGDTLRVRTRARERAHARTLVPAADGPSVGLPVSLDVGPEWSSLIAVLPDAPTHPRFVGRKRSREGGEGGEASGARRVVPERV